MPHALPRPPPRARRAPLATSAFAALDDAHIDALLKAAEELAAVTSESNGDAHGAETNPATTSPAALDALRAAITQRAQLVTLRNNVRALEQQWLEAATADPGETPLRLRRMERRRRELDAQLDAQRTRVRAACNDALAKFDAWWTERDETTMSATTHRTFSETATRYIRRCNLRGTAQTMDDAALAVDRGRNQRYASTRVSNGRPSQSILTHSCQ